MAAIARSLNERGVLSPGAYDRARNRHRQATLWTVRTVAAILANARYTGRQVWNRQFTDHREARPGDKRSSLGPVRVWNPREEWETSQERTHPALVSDADFLRVQQTSAVLEPVDGSSRRYALTGRLLCAVCGRRLVAHWMNKKPGYRCRHGHTTAHPTDVAGPKWVFWAEARVFATLAGQHLELADLQDAEDLGTYLRAYDLVVVCGLGTVAIEAAAVDEPDFALPSAVVQPRPGDRAGEPVVAVRREPVQLALPLAEPRRRSRRMMLAAASEGEGQKAENPTRYRVQRE
ncbi:MULTISPECIES: recombinase family protein [unclassified Actinoplanes]|uniref:recombinase family protein n=1 Tax=unclassified Actinoplanes TaxID=2626549 RepID=UPI001E2A4A76|nr:MULTISPECIES: recombinase family protein [unclassified Actinoplanes]